MDRLNLLYLFNILKVLPAVQEEIESQILASDSFKGEKMTEILVSLNYAEPCCSLPFFLVTPFLCYLSRFQEFQSTVQTHLVSFAACQ